MTYITLVAGGSSVCLDVYESLPGSVWPSCNTHSQHMRRYMKEEHAGERDGERGGRQGKRRGENNIHVPGLMIYVYLSTCTIYALNIYMFV